MSQENKNMLIVGICAIVIFMGFDYFFPSNKIKDSNQAVDSQTIDSSPQKENHSDLQKNTSFSIRPIPKEENSQGLPHAEENQEQEDNIHIPIDSKTLEGSLSLKGGVINDLILKKYHETPNQESSNIQLLNPPSSKNPYYAEFGWTTQDSNILLPNERSIWTLKGDRLTPNTPITLTWKSPQGLLFEKTISLDDRYVFTIHQKVYNLMNQSVTLHPYALITRAGSVPVSDYFVLHEGPIGYLDDRLQEKDYKDVLEKKKISYTSTGGWIGFTDKYWLTALLPDQQSPITANFRGTIKNGNNAYQTDCLGPAYTVQPTQSIETTQHFFAGAKVVDLLDAYSQTLGIPYFDKAVDFGWFYFITKPIFYAVSYFYELLGNFGLAIMLLTILIRLAFFPLANKSYHSMQRMKKFQPEIKRLQELYKDDKVKLQQETMAFYKKNKINPVSGCLPILVQLPVFFALYKVLFVTLEMRHAPFYGWIKDLSAPDPTTLFNLFGLIPWTPPSFLMIGALPLLMGSTMIIQQKMNPAPMDPVQAKVFLIMPIFFTYLLAQFPAGLVLYWTWSNLLAITQQWFIMHYGHKLKFFKKKKVSNS